MSEQNEEMNQEVSHLGDLLPVLEFDASLTGPRIIIIDESDARNPLGGQGNHIDLSIPGPTVESSEGFAHNDENHQLLAEKLVEILELRAGQFFLDIGFGMNHAPMQSFARSGMQVCGLDIHTDIKQGVSLWRPPSFVQQTEEGIRIYGGDVSDIGSPTSDLRDQRFDLMTFIGSWSSGGNNFTVGGEISEAKFHNQDHTEESTATEFTIQEQVRILTACRSHLTEGGRIGVVSSRYAYHGAGYNFVDLPEEKLDFLDLYLRFAELGAKEIIFLGVSQLKFAQMVNQSFRTYPQELLEYRLDRKAIDSVTHQLAQVSNLPAESPITPFLDNPQVQIDRNKAIIEATKDIPEINHFARIDGIFAKF